MAETYAYEPREILASVRRKAPKRAKAYEFIVAEIAAGRPFPTVKQIDAHFGWKNSAHSMLQGLVADGLLFRFYLDLGISRMKFGLIERATVQA